MGITQITDNSFDDEDPRINDTGFVVWQGYDGSDTEIFLYDGMSITQITNNSYDDRSPQINDNGYVVWQRYDGSDWEIFLYDGMGITQITDNSFDDEDPRINDTGFVVWQGYDGSDTEIFLDYTFRLNLHYPMGSSFRGSEFQTGIFNGQWYDVEFDSKWNNRHKLYLDCTYTIG